MGRRTQRRSRGAPRFARREEAVGSARIAATISTPDERTYGYDDATVTIELPSSLAAPGGAPDASETIALRAPVGTVAVLLRYGPASSRPHRA